MKRIINIFLIIFGIITISSQPVFAQNKLDDDLRQISFLAEVITIIQQEYVDGGKVSTDLLIRGAVNGMLSSLDRYSVYFDPNEAQEFNDQTNGSFKGLGIQVDFIKNWLTIIEPMPGSPAFEAGIIGGDRIIEIDGQSTKGISYEAASKLLQGEIGTPVTLLIARENEPELLTKTIVRSQIVTHSVESAETKMLDATTGYVRLRTFTPEAAIELESNINELKIQGMRSLILDLRDNVGGMFDVAVDICDLFIDANANQLLVQQRDQNNNETSYYSKKPSNGNYLLVVLVNEFTASSSEIVAGCLQDHERGILVGPAGHKTFGKGSVQSLIELTQLPGAALKLTTAKYVTPKGRVIDDIKGLTPDIQVPITDEQRNQIRQHNALGNIPEQFLQSKPPMVQISNTIEDQSNEKNGTSQVEVYDIELLSAYQFLKGAEILHFGGQNQYSFAYPRN